ncbi:hypothetical protein C8J56DRAFT_1077927 [Mycena floridula]|nr:hypothetical protein C8J56DRAFT_1077927 [Mycena floridula]
MTSSPSQSSKNFSGSETSAAIVPCIEDDKEFIRNAREGNMAVVDGRRMIKGGKRVTLLWRALRRLSGSLQKRIFIELLQGSDDGEDIWLWNEGDEALTEWEFYCFSSPPPWHSAATALERRLTRTQVQTPQREEVKFASFEMRAAMISWLALTSTVYKSADKEGGFRDREEWDMQKWIQVWYYSLPRRVYLCKPTPGSESLASWTPSPALVVLRCIWDETGQHIQVDERRDFCKWLLDRPMYGLHEANEFFSRLPRDTDEDQYLSWVNTYPRYLRPTVTRYTHEDWQGMDDCIAFLGCEESLNIRSWCAAMFWNMIPDGLSYSIHVKRFIDVWRHSAFRRPGSLPPPTPAPEFRNAIRDSGHSCWEGWEKEIDDYVAAMAFLEQKPRVVGIDMGGLECQVCCLQCRLRKLGETLPVEKPVFSADLTELLVMMISHAGLLYSGEESEGGDGGFDDEEASREDERTPVVLTHQSHDNTPNHRDNNPRPGTGVRNPSQIHNFHQNTYPNFPGAVSNSEHQEQQDLHYTLDDGDDQSRNMRTDQIDLNFPHRPQPPILRAVHLTEELKFLLCGVLQEVTLFQLGCKCDHQLPYKIPGTHTPQHTVAPTVPAASKPKMIEKIKTFLTSELDSHSVYLARTHNGHPKLSWVDFETKLKDEGLELVNWPNGVPEPGKDERADPNKGIAGISVRDLTAIYRAIHNTTAPLKLRRSSGQQAEASILYSYNAIFTISWPKPSLVVTLDQLGRNSLRVMRLPLCITDGLFHFASQLSRIDALKLGRLKGKKGSTVIILSALPKLQMPNTWPLDASSLGTQHTSQKLTLMIIQSEWNPSNIVRFAASPVRKDCGVICTVESHEIYRIFKPSPVSGLLDIVKLMIDWELSRAIQLERDRWWPQTLRPKPSTATSVIHEELALMMPLEANNPESEDELDAVTMVDHRAMSTQENIDS